MGSSDRELICPSVAIFDTELISREIDRELKDLSDAQEMRTQAVKQISTAFKAGFENINEAFRASPKSSGPATASYSYLTDCIVRTVQRVATLYIHPLANPTRSERIAILAVGGYGRGEMAPYSDVDLLFLIPGKRTPWAESVVETMLYIFWDLKLKVGHATRTIGECVRLGGEDFTIRTSLLEARFVDGDQTLADSLGSRLWSELFKNTGPEFVEAKLLERAERHKRQGGQRYMVEPNVKEGKGGLRDLQSLFWIAKYLHRVQNPEALVKHGMFTRTEFEVFSNAEDFLWTVRCHLHLFAGRAEERLDFEGQMAIAPLMGFSDRGGLRAVERFMKRYYLAARDVGNLTRIICAAVETDFRKRRSL